MLIVKSCQNKVSADMYHMTTLWDKSLELIEDAHKVLVFHQIAGPSQVITLGEKE